MADRYERWHDREPARRGRGRRDRRPDQPRDEGDITAAPRGRPEEIEEQESYELDREYIETPFGGRELSADYGWGPMRRSTRGSRRGPHGRGGFSGYDDNAAVMRSERGLGAVPLAGELRGRGPKGYRRSAERIHEDVCEELTDHPHLDCSDVEVSVEEDGTVVLEGQLQSARLKRLAEDIAWEARGVQDVVNLIRVRRGHSAVDEGERSEQP